MGKIFQQSSKISLKYFTTSKNYSSYDILQGDHSPDNVKFADISVTVRSTHSRHSAC